MAPAKGMLLQGNVARHICRGDKCGAEHSVSYSVPAQHLAAQPGCVGHRVVICGGGIIGAATAYYLATQHGVAATVVEREELAAAASGKAGGFLALDWNDSSPVGQVAR